MSLTIVGVVFLLFTGSAKADAATTYTRINNGTFKAVADDGSITYYYNSAAPYYTGFSGVSFGAVDEGDDYVDKTTSGQTFVGYPKKPGNCTNNLVYYGNEEYMDLKTSSLVAGTDTCDATVKSDRIKLSGGKVPTMYMFYKDGATIYPIQSNTAGAAFEKPAKWTDVPNDTREIWIQDVESTGSACPTFFIKDSDGGGYFMAPVRINGGATTNADKVYQETAAAAGFDKNNIVSCSADRGTNDNDYEARILPTLDRLAGGSTEPWDNMVNWEPLEISGGGGEFYGARLGFLDSFVGPKSAGEYREKVQAVLGNQDELDKITGTPGTTGNEQPEVCDIFGNWSLRWLVCPIFEMVASVTSWLDGLIQELLEYDMATFQNGGLDKAWEVFRTFAVALLVIAALVMVFSQALGFSFLDAYTIKKVLPRLLIAIIGITLSWELLKFVIEFFNVLGSAIGSIITNAFAVTSSGTGNSDFWTNSGYAATAFAGGFGAYFAVPAAAASFPVWGPVFFSLLASAALALTIGVLVLGVRLAVISACVIIAPLAIAAWVLPGTKKLWDFWQNTLMTALLMFPIVMGFIALGKGMAFVMGGMSGTISVILSILFYIAPYFLLPFAFKLAGGLMKTIFSIADDKSKGFFDKQRNFRAERKKNKIEHQIEGKQGGMMADFRRRSASARHGGAFYGASYRGGRQNYMEQVRAKSMQEGGSILSNDEVMRRVKDGMSEHAFIKDRSQELYQDAERAYMATNSGVAPTAAMAAKMRQAAQNQAHEEAGRVHHALGGFQTAHAMDVATQAGMASGSFYNSKDYHTDLNEMLGDLAAMRNRGSITEGDAIGLMGKFMAKRPDMAKMGSGTKYALLTQATANVAAGKSAVDANTARAALVDSMSHMTSQDHMLVDGRSAQKSAQALKDHLQHTATTFGKGSVEYARAASTAGHIYESMSMAPPENRNYFADLVYSQKITDNGNAAANTVTFTDGSTDILGTQTMLQDMKKLAQTEQYQHGKKEWDTGAAAANAAAAAGAAPPPPGGGTPPPGGGGPGGP